MTQPQQHCDHYPVCYLIGMSTGCIADECHEICEYDTRSSPAHSPQNPLSLKNLTVGAIVAYEAGLKDGATVAREQVLKEAMGLMYHRSIGYRILESMLYDPKSLSSNTREQLK